MAKIVTQPKSERETASGGSKKRGSIVVSEGFKRSFTDSERAEISVKRQEMRKRLYASG